MTTTKRLYGPQKMRPAKFWFLMLEWDGKIKPAAPPPPIIVIEDDVYRYDPHSNQIWKNEYEFTDVGPGCWPCEMYKWAKDKPNKAYFMLFARECLEYSRKYGLTYQFNRRLRNKKIVHHQGCRPRFPRIDKIINRNMRPTFH